MNVPARWIASSLGVAASLLAGPLALADLDAYVRRDDGAFSWSVTGRAEAPAGTISHVALRSQVWQGIPWDHRLRIYEPAEPAHKDAVLLFITGGDHDSQPKPQDHAMGFTLARACGATCAVLPQVPNQPLLDGK
ncbi:MAG: PhoPQ-activated protein PqaA family protein, partial [Planctomycetaceae bacterium]